MGKYLGFRVATAVALVVVPSTVVLAHHSFSAYNRSESAKRTIEGTVKLYALVNPHGTVRIETPGSGGRSALWSFELSSATQLTALGWNRDSVKVGEKVEITYFPLRFGSNGGLLYSIKRPNGSTLQGTAEPDRGYPKPREGGAR